MSSFDKKLFSWDGMYLMYKGDFEGARLMQDAAPNCHPSWKGLTEPAFIARFKYGGYKPHKAWTNFLVKNATVERYLELSKETNPVQAMKTLGYKGKL